MAVENIVRIETENSGTVTLEFANFGDDTVKISVQNRKPFFVSLADLETAIGTLRP